jgi:SAM-dependent methyltransferase
MNLREAILEHSLAFRLSQFPFNEKKFAPILAHNDLRCVRRVLDVGCGPGTNAPYFAHADYLGIDINEKYIADARRRHKRDFLVADVTTYTAPPDQRYDFVLANSLFHHLDTPGTLRVLSHLSTLLTEDGNVHILDLVLPARRCLARMMAEWDRGEFPRPLEEWRQIFYGSFEPVVFEPFSVTRLGACFLSMVYFKGRVANSVPRRSGS